MTEEIVSEGKEYIGTATMREDGSVVLSLRAEDPSGAVGHGEFVYTPTQAEYKDVIAHLGGIKPGESKPVLPWD